MHAVGRCCNSGNSGTPASRRSAMAVRNSSRPIARIFRATAAPGCRDELLQRFHSSSAALVNSKTGCLKYRILEPVDASAPEVVFESIWSDLDAVKVAFGDAWQQSYLPEGYSALMTAYSVHHFFSLARARRSSDSPLSFLPATFFLRKRGAPGGAPDFSGRAENPTFPSFIDSNSDSAPCGPEFYFVYICSMPIISQVKCLIIGLPRDDDALELV